MKLSEFKGEDAYNAIEGLLDPMAEICADEELVNCAKSGEKLKLVKRLISAHRQSINTILAVLDKADPETYQVSLITLPVKILELLNDEEIIKLFK